MMSSRKWILSGELATSAMYPDIKDLAPRPTFRVMVLSEAQKVNMRGFQLEGLKEQISRQSKRFKDW